MSTDPHEYQIPVIIDVTAHTYEDAAEGAVDALAQGRIVGRTYSAGNGYGDSRVESWWTVEEGSKPYDGNDNEHGVVVFQHDLDYLHSLLRSIDSNDSVDPARHARLLHYFAPGARCGSEPTPLIG